MPRRDQRRKRTDQEIRRTNARGQAEDDRTQDVRAAIAPAAQEQRTGREDERGRRNVAEPRAAIDPDVRQERVHGGSAGGGHEVESDLAREKKERRKESDRSEHDDRLQRTKLRDAEQ